MVLGILGSALWENMFRDLFNFAGKFLLTIATLGIESYKDNIYKNIAKGFNESVSLQIYFFQQMMLFGFIIFSCSIMYILRKHVLLKRERKIQEKSISHSISDTMIKHPLFVWFLSFYIIFAGTVTFLDYTKRFYINNSISYFNQLVKINSPFLTDEERKTTESLFAQISNKKDYLYLINKLRENAQKNNQRVPEFNFTF